jgi:hypothetical protein
MPCARWARARTPPTCSTSPASRSGRLTLPAASGALFSSFRRLTRECFTDGGARHPLTADQASFIKNRCQLRDNDKTDFDYLNVGIDECRR